MKDKIRELRNILPIPIGEAKQLLIENGGDIETCALLYMGKSIEEIKNATNVNNEIADKHYRAEKFDINRAISAIKEEIYDSNYKTIVGINTTSLQFVKDWIFSIETYDFGTSLSYKNLELTINTLLLIPELKEIALLLQDAKNKYDIIFEGYNDSLPLDDFVRRNRKLDDVPSFRLANQQIPLQISYIKNWINRHWRNVQDQ